MVIQIIFNKEQKLIKPQNYTENAEMFNFWVIVREARLLGGELH
jgi:hypothetical protein